MKIQPGLQRWLAVVVLVGLMVTAMVACGGAAPTEEMVADGETLLQERCTECHPLDRVTSASMTRDGWEANVEDMIAKGAQLTDAEKEVLVDYLAETYGP